MSGQGSVRRMNSLIGRCGRSAKRAWRFMFVLLVAMALAAQGGERPNILFITVDDMNCDSMGAYGCPLTGTTPNMDRLAAEGLRFEYAHVVVGNCMPSRNCMYSGLYPHNNRVEGFYQVQDKDYPVLCDLMKEGGYFTGIRGKVSHSTPHHPYPWDLVLDTVGGGREHPKEVASYYRSTKTGIAAAKAARKPFCLVINISDPHKPFYATGKGGETVSDKNRPSRVFTADEVPVPGFLPDDPIVRKELAQYYSTVRRADDCLGATLRALKESGSEEETMIMFLSDHGMPLPFAKTAVWHHSTRTPWIVKWPGVAKAGAVDREHMISGVDVLATLLDIAGLPVPERQDGRSFAPVIRGGKQQGRDFIVKEYNENSGAGRHPMRSVQTRQYCYIFNPWANGERVFRTATMGTLTYRRMKELAQTDAAVAERVKLFDLRVLEELYDVEKDPDCLQNLIDEPAHRGAADRHRKLLEEWMVKTGDHALEPFRGRGDRARLEAYMSRVEREALERRKLKQEKAPKRTKRRLKLISLRVPESATAGGTVKVVIPYALKAPLKEQLAHVTLKDGAGRRIDRKVLKISGKGELEVEFDVPAMVSGGKLNYAAFVGADYPNNLQHVTAGPTAVE